MRTFFLKLLVLLIPLSLFGYLLWIDIAPSGERIIRIEAGEASPYLDHFLPQDRLLPLAWSENREPYDTVVKDPVYFSLHPPMTDFESVELEFLFATENQPVVEVGPLVDTFSRTFDLRPLQNEMIDALDWSAVTEGDVTIFSRNNDVKDAAAFLSHPPDRSTIATYHADLNAPVILPDYQPISGTQSIEVTLRGDHKYLTYLKGESFYLKAEFWDMNRTLGTDSGAIIVRDATGNIVLSKEFEDDGDTREDQTPGPQTVELSGNGLAEGVYSVELKATSDIFWHRFTTKQRYMTFTNQLYLGDEIGYLAATRPVSLVTDAKHLTMKTLHGSAIQTVKVGDQSIQIAASHAAYQARVPTKGVVAVMVPKGDLQVTGAGKFAFTSTMFFDPEAIRLTDDIDLDTQGIHYIVAQYVKPATEGSWKSASVTFGLEDLKSEDGSVAFALSAPGIVDREGKVKVQAVTLRFKKAPMDWKQFLQAMRERFPFGL